MQPGPEHRPGPWVVASPCPRGGTALEVALRGGQPLSFVPMYKSLFHIICINSAYFSTQG